MPRFFQHARATFAAGLMVVVLSAPGVAAAQSNDVVVSGSSGTVTVPPPPVTERPQVRGETTTDRDASSTPVVQGAPKSEGLAFTGADIVGLSVIGLAAVAAGVALLVVRRRRSA